jgi:hypothetical protein
MKLITLCWGRPAVVCAILRNTYEAPTIRRASSLVNRHLRVNDDAALDVGN